MGLKWFGDGFLQDMQLNLGKNSVKAAKYLEGKIKAKIGTQGPPPSKPYTPPHMDTGALERSIRYVLGPGNLSWVVGSGLDYAAALEFGPTGSSSAGSEDGVEGHVSGRRAFPFVRPGYEEKKKEAVAAVAASIRLGLQKLRFR